MTELYGRGIAAFVGASVGDALGWPQENRSSNIDRTMSAPVMEFRSWKRRAGTRFNAYEETIEAGEHSDDTQMICIVARSIIRGGTNWRDWLTDVELPLFPVYQRGAGRALLSACRAWASGVPPWLPHRDTNPRAYFEAGGNGGAMRVLPHAVRAVATGRPSPNDDVFADTVTTHGHPRAIVGSLVHAAALRTALSKKGTLGYGELLDALLDDRRSWGAQPSLDVLPPGWREAWKESIGSDFWRTWTDTVDEMISLLSIARQGMSSGALASERETLDALGSTHSKVMGAGTVTAAAAAFLASRSAANPRSGLLAAAFIPRADSDTLASMTTSLLAALGREDWLFPLNREVQDVAYLERLGGAVVSAPRGATMRRPRVTSNQTRALLSRIDHASPDDLVELPDGRYANVVAVEPLRSLVQSSVAATYRLSVDDGQTMHVVRVHRRSEGPRSTQQVFPIDDRESRGVVLPAVLHVGMILPVSDLEKMRSFYENLLGLAVTRIGSSFVTFNDVLALSTAAAPPLPSTGRLRVYVEVSSVQQVWDRLQQHGVDIVEPLGRGSGRKRFTCLDPEGNVIELIEPPPAPMAIEGHFAGHDRTSGRPKVI